MPEGQSRGERELSVFILTLSIGSVCLPVTHLLLPWSPPAPLTILFTFPAIPPPPHSPSGIRRCEVRASNSVSAEVIDSSHGENSPALGVSGAEPESWRGEQDMETVHGWAVRTPPDTPESEQEGNGGTNHCFIGGGTE